MRSSTFHEIFSGEGRLEFPKLWLDPLFLSVVCRDLCEALLLLLLLLELEDEDFDPLLLLLCVDFEGGLLSPVDDLAPPPPPPPPSDDDLDRVMAGTSDGSSGSKKV